MSSIASEPSSMQDAGPLPQAERSGGGAERPSSPPDAVVSDILEEHSRLQDQVKRLTNGHAPAAPGPFVSRERRPVSLVQEACASGQGSCSCRTLSPQSTSMARLCWLCSCQACHEAPAGVGTGCALAAAAHPPCGCSWCGKAAWCLRSSAPPKCQHLACRNAATMAAGWRQPRSWSQPTRGWRTPTSTW